MHLANAFRAEGDVSGKVMTGIARSAPDLLSELGNRTTLLLWALDNGFRHVAQHLLIDMPVDQPAGWVGPCIHGTSRRRIRDASVYGVDFRLYRIDSSTLVLVFVNPGPPLGLCLCRQRWVFELTPYFPGDRDC